MPAAAARTRLERGYPDLVLLDVMLPDGLRDLPSAAQFLGRAGALPERPRNGDTRSGGSVSAATTTSNHPPPAEVVARVKAVSSHPPGPRGSASRLEVDLAAHEVSCEGRQVELTAREFELLRVLVEHPRQVFSRDQLFELVWGSFGDRSAVAVYIGRLRQKFEPDPPARTSSPSGSGYRLDPGR